MEPPRRSGRARSSREKVAEEPAELWEFDSLSESSSSHKSDSADDSVEGVEHSDSSDDEDPHIFDGDCSCFRSFSGPAYLRMATLFLSLLFAKASRRHTGL